MITQFQSVSQTTDSSIKRSRRFQRTNRISTNSKSRSRDSNTASLSKFYTKNIVEGKNGKKKEVEDKIFGNINRSVEQIKNDCHLCQRRPQASTVNTSKEEKQSVLVVNNQEIVKTINQMPQRSGEASLSIDKLTNTLKHSLKTIKQLQRTIFDKNREINGLKQNNTELSLQITELKAKNHKKTLKDIKSSIAQEKINQIRTENQNLKLQVKELKAAKQNQIMHHFCLNSIESGSMILGTQTLNPQWDHETTENLQNCLKDAKIEISRLHSFYSNELRRVIREHEVVVQNKNNEYLKLKKKFIKYLKNFNHNLQTNPHQRVRQFKNHKIEQEIDDDLSERSFGLSISSDDQ